VGLYTQALMRLVKMANSGKQTLKCFLLFVPFFVLAVISGGQYDDLHSNGLPDTIPSRKTILAGLGITAVMVRRLLF
jgi:hypothetical protein